MDKVSDSQAIRHVLEALGSEAVIPPRPAPECSYRGSNHTEAMAYDQDQDKFQWSCLTSHCESLEYVP